MPPSYQQKKELGVVSTKRGKETKLMAVADGTSTPVALLTTSASLAECTLAKKHFDTLLLGRNLSESLVAKRMTLTLRMKNYRQR